MMLLIIEALLILAALGQDHSAAPVEGKIFPLDMALNSVDDQYNGCRDNMSELVKTKLLNNELNNSNNPIFKLAWDKGIKFHSSPNNNLTKNHEIAIYVYSDALVFKNFTFDTRSGKKQYTDKTYKWYSFHFLLTDAIQILNNLTKQTNKPDNCNTTYRGTTVEFDKNVLNTTVRFGSFTSSSLDPKVAQVFGNVSCFKIRTCEGADVAKYSKHPNEKEVLIPPYEKFNVTAVEKGGGQMPWCQTVFILNSTGTRSYLNCTLFPKPSKTKTKYYALNKVL